MLDLIRETFAHMTPENAAFAVIAFVVASVIACIEHYRYTKKG